MFLGKKSNRFTWAVFCSALFILSLQELVTTGFAEEIELPQVVDRIVAKVNDEIILLSELDEALESYAGQMGAHNSSGVNKEELMFKLRRDILTQLVEKKLAEQQIKALGIRVEEGEIIGTIERVKQNNFFTDETLRQRLAENGMTMDQYRRDIKEQILRAKLIDYKVKSNIIITKEDVQSYYNDHHEEYAGAAKYHLRNIIMKTPVYGEGKQNVLQRMETVLARLQQGEAFADLAVIYSESPIAENGGDIGLFKPEDLDESIRDALEKIKTGEFTAIIDTDLGYQIFYLEEIVTTEGISLEKASPAIEEKLYKQELEIKFKSWISDLKEDAHIQIIE
jgi:peptidyl-prolyl cis-trans isomerase SurA